MCYCPTPTLHLNLALTGDFAFLLSPKKTYSVWFIRILNYGDTENFLINHLLLVIPMSYPCHYSNVCPHKPHKHAHTHTHSLSLSHTHTLYLKHIHKSSSTLKIIQSQQANTVPEWNIMLLLLISLLLLNMFSVVVLFVYPCIYV